MLAEAIAAGVESLKVRRELKREMRLDLVLLEPDALFNMVAKRQRGWQTVFKANDAARRQT